jgi:hypothetical protein
MVSTPMTSTNLYPKCAHFRLCKLMERSAIRLDTVSMQQ